MNYGKAVLDKELGVGRLDDFIGKFARVLFFPPEKAEVLEQEDAAFFETIDRLLDVGAGDIINEIYWNIKEFREANGDRFQ